MSAAPLSAEAVAWLASGERGLSSETIFQHILRIKVLNGERNAHPWDPDDLRRCRLLLEQVPELAIRFEEMRTCSAVWRRLVDHWAELCRLMDEECGGWPPKLGSRAPQTYALMERLTRGRGICT